MLRFSWLLSVAVLFASCEGMALPQQKKSRISVAETIPMTVWANDGYFLGGKPDSPVAVFSPDWAQFVILVSKGNIDRNTNEYSLLLFRTKDVVRQTLPPTTLLTMSSSSNRPAIKHVKWLTNDSLIFIGEKERGTAQVYRFNVSTKNLKTLTESPTPVEAFDVSNDGRRLVYEADSPRKWTLDAKEVERHGVLVSKEDPLNILVCDGLADQGDSGANRELFTQTLGKNPTKIASTDYMGETLPLAVSPTGRYALLVVYVREIPQSWSAYQDRLLQPYLAERRKEGSPSNVNQYMLLDMASGQLEPLFDAPKSWYNYGAAWAEDESSVIVSGTYLPLNVADPAEREIREKHAFVVEVNLRSRKITKITDADLAVERRDQRSGKLILKPAYSWSKSTPQAYEQKGSNWEQVPITDEDLRDQAPIAVTLEEDMNDPPRVFVAEPDGRNKALLFDLNPQFAQIDFGKVEAITWKAGDGHQVEGGLYLPPGYDPGHRYPLVIQTHGFRKDRFRVNGPWNSAFAGQPLTAEGIVVLQVGNSSDPSGDAGYVNTPEESLRQMRAYEGAIDYLDGRGVINRDKVGIMGFSRTVLHVVYTLTHSKYEFAAATLADGFDGGYMGYLLWGGSDYIGVNGGIPTGSGMQSWLQNSAGFNLDKIKVPIRLEYYGRWGALGGWSLYSGLSLLNKPVDFVWLPFGTHLLVRPWDRLASQQGNVEWFKFWLREGEDSADEKKDDYLRWKALKKLLSHGESQPLAKKQSLLEAPSLKDSIGHKIVLGLPCFTIFLAVEIG